MIIIQVSFNFSMECSNITVKQKLDWWVHLDLEFQVTFYKQTASKSEKLLKNSSFK